MDSTYDIFRRVRPDQPPIWVETVKGIAEARKRLSELSTRSPGEYLLWNATTGKFVELE